MVEKCFLTSSLLQRLVDGAGAVKLTKDGKVLLNEMVNKHNTFYMKFVFILYW